MVRNDARSGRLMRAAGGGGSRALAAVLLVCCADSRKAGGGSWRAAANYDREACVFDPSGRILQLEYADEAVRRGELVAAAIYDGVVVICAVLPKNETALLNAPRPKIRPLDDERVWAAATGLRADGRVLVDEAHAYARSDFETEPPSLRSIARHLGDEMHECARGGGKRAFGARLIFCGFDSAEQKDQPEIWSSGPSGDVTSHAAFVAMGENADEARDCLRDDALVTDARGLVSHVVSSALKCASNGGRRQVDVVALAKGADGRVRAWQARLGGDDFGVDDLAGGGPALAPHLARDLDAALVGHHDAADSRQRRRALRRSLRHRRRGRESPPGEKM
ncbi:nucleophile aminohydrolase [Pelagophyceae sp. CCMP2097]|nr:nucleophile aminohydrolase [Pelagophyceae sp. CCMP2097]